MAKATKAVWKPSFLTGEVQLCLGSDTNPRGPAKGYLEALEHRLEATEAALLRLASVSNDDIIEAAFQSPLQRPLFSQLNEETEPSGNEPRKAAMLEFWEQYPLETPQEVLSWARESRRRQGSNGRQISHHRQNILTTTSQYNDQGLSDTEVSLNDDSLLAQQGLATEQPENSLSHHVDHGHDNQPLSSPRDNESTLDVPLEFQRMYVW